MTQAFNLAQFANNVNSSGQAAASTSLSGAVAPANGGTGLNALTLNNVILGNATSPVQLIAPGASGNVLRSDGTTWASAANTGISNALYQIFLGSGTFTVPAGVTSVYATVIGGGGGGAGGGTSVGIASGASNSGAAWITGLTPGATIAVTVGNGGAGGQGNGGAGTNGTTGGASSFGTYITCTGGGGGRTGSTDTVTTTFLRAPGVLTGRTGGNGATGNAGCGAYSGGGGGGPGFSSGGGGGAAYNASPNTPGNGGAAFNGTAGSNGSAYSGNQGGAGGAGGSNATGATGGAGGATGVAGGSGGSGGGGGAGGVIVQWA